MADKKFEVSKIYLKDISVESPNAPQIFKTNWEPKVELNLDHKNTLLENDFYDVELTLTVTAKVEEKTAYLIEIKQCGIFLISGFADHERDFLLGGAAPNIIFPYAREAITDLSQRAGFPPMLLNPINLEAVYQQKMQQQSNQATDNAASDDEKVTH